MPMWVSRRAEAILDNAVFAMIVIVAATVASSLGLKKLMDAPSAIVLGLFIFACLTVSWYAIGGIASRHARRRSEKLTPKDIENQIWEWLRKYQFTLTPISDPTCDFKLNAVLPEQAPFGVTIAKLLLTPWVTIATDIGFEENSRDNVRQRAPMLVRDMGVEILKLGLEHSTELDAKGSLVKIQVRQLLPFDEKTTDLALLTTMRVVRGGAALIADMYNRVADQAAAVPVTPPPSKPSSEEPPPKGGAS